MLSARLLEMPINILDCSLGLRLNFLDILVFVRLPLNPCSAKPEYGLVQVDRDNPSGFMDPGTAQFLHSA